MTLAYLLNSYPMTSTTFIRREIAAIESSGVAVQRFAVRRWGEALVDPLDLEEVRKTSYILTRNLPALLTTAIWESIRHPLQAIRAGRMSLTLFGLSQQRSLVKHIGYFVQALYARREFARRGITHVHVHFSTNAATVALLSWVLGGPGFSFTVHGPDELVDLRAEGIELKARYATAIVAISEFCRGEIEAAIDPRDAGKIKIVHCGLELDAYESEEISDPNVLVCVGRLCPQKGQVHIPAAVDVVRRRHPNIKVMLVGDGESRAEIEAEITRFGLQNHVVLAGWQPNSTVRRIVASGRALLLPSYAEGLPVVIMEAFALGRPVITTPIAGIPELVDDSCGWFCQPGDVDGLAEAISECMDFSLSKIKAMGAMGRDRVRRAHNLHTIATQLIDLFNSSEEQIHDQVPDYARRS